MSQGDILKIKLRNDSQLTEEIIDSLLYSAKMIILSKRYPLHNYPTDDNGDYVLESRYSDLQIRIAVELYAKEGVEGQTSHVENAVTRNYASAGISSALLNEIVPKGKVLGVEDTITVDDYIVDTDDEDTTDEDVEEEAEDEESET